MATSIVVSAAQWIGCLLIQEARPLFGVEEQVQGLKEELDFMQQYLEDADVRQDEREINASVRLIRMLAYDAEDVIDTYLLKVQRSHENRLIRFGYFVYKVPRIYTVLQQIKVIRTSLKQVKDNLISFGVRRDTSLEVGLRRQRPPSYPYDDIDGDFVVGLENEIPKLIEVLTGEGKIQTNILSIVGMGGSGKTTLARKLYNHPYIRECFNCTAWVSISNDWSTSHVLSEILREAGVPEATPDNLSASNNRSVPEFVKRLHNALKKKSYLVVLDDVWKREALEDILPALPQGNFHGGSKIIITTRNRDIIQFQNMYVHEPPRLSLEEGWVLFHKIALSHGRHRSMASFENLGKEMLQKCDGLPLAIVALAGILNMKKSIAEWQQVSEAVRSRVIDGTGTHMYGRVGDMLALSYNDLPYYLKPCFLYLSLFSEDYIIPAGMLTRMWIAEGLISAQGDMSLEDAAMQVLVELSHRFMIQVVRTNFQGVIKAIRLHDLLRDVCLRKAKELSFLQVYTPASDPGSSNASAFSIQPRRAALHSGASFPAQIPHLRSLVLLTCSNSHNSTQVHKGTLTLDLIIVPQSYKLLRLLNLWGTRTVDGSLPPQIGSLVHLRYLEIRATNIVELPSSIGNLRYLLVLDYRDVDAGVSAPIIRIPSVLEKLVLLRHLFLPIGCPWSMEELKLSRMRSLQTLWGVKQVTTGQWFSREISKLSTTLKKLKIVVSSENDLKAAFSCPSLLSDKLQTFHCELKSGIALCNAEPLSHRKCLHKLILIGKVQMELFLILPTNLVTLELKDSMLECRDPMADLGVLAHLKLLKLSNAFSGTALECKTGSFPQLEELFLEGLKYWKVWKIDKGAMPCLKKLEISRCWSLKQFPQNLKFVTALQQLEFFQMPGSFNDMAAEHGWSAQKLRLPHNYGAIIKRADSSVDTSSIRKLYKQLTAGIFLDNGKQMYWVVEEQHSYSNCFMVSSLRHNTGNGGPSRRRKNVIIRGGTMPSVKDVDLNSLAVDVLGEFDTADLSLRVTYEIVWVVMLESVVHNLVVDEIDQIKRYTFTVDVEISWQDKSRSPKRCSERNREPLNQWVQVSGGIFETMTPVKNGNGKLQVRLRYMDGKETLGLKVQGFIIQPRLVGKNSAKLEGKQM